MSIHALRNERIINETMSCNCHSQFSQGARRELQSRNEEDPRAVQHNGAAHHRAHLHGEGPKGYLSTEQEVICFNVVIRPINNVVQNLLTAHGSLIRGTGPTA